VTIKDIIDCTPTMSDPGADSLHASTPSVNPNPTYKYKSHSLKTDSLFDSLSEFKTDLSVIVKHLMVKKYDVFFCIPVS
jgi:hypothetical protein